MTKNKSINLVIFPTHLIYFDNYKYLRPHFNAHGFLKEGILTFLNCRRGDSNSRSLGKRGMDKQNKGIKFLTTRERSLKLLCCSCCWIFWKNMSNMMQSGKLKIRIDREKWGKIGKIEKVGKIGKIGKNREKSGKIGKIGKLGIRKKLTKFTNFNEEMKWK